MDRREWYETYRKAPRRPRTYNANTLVALRGALMRLWGVTKHTSQEMEYFGRLYLEHSGPPSRWVRVLGWLRNEEG